MRSWIVIVIAAGVLAVAWVADRLLVQAVVDFGTYGGSDGTHEGLLAIDRLGRVGVLAGVGAIAVLALRGGVHRSVLIGLIGVGVVATVLPVIGYGLGLEALYDLSRATYLPAQFVVWAGAGMAVAGVGALLAGDENEAMAANGLLRLGLAAAVVIVALPLDAAVETTFIAASSREGSLLTATAIDLAARLLLMAGLVALLWLTLRTRPNVAVGTILATAGFAVFVGLALASLLARGGPLSPFVDSPLSNLHVVPYATRWAAGGVMLIGLWELLGARAPQPAHPAGLAAYGT